MVVKAIAREIEPFEDETIVAVKTIYKHADNEMMKVLICELKIMTHLGKHLNIVNLLGAITKHISRRELMVITEFCAQGNLLNFLQSQRSTFEDFIIDDELIMPSADHAITHESCRSQIVTAEVSNYVRMPTKTPPDSIVNLVTISQNTSIVINTGNLISWSFQISRGMDYLASKRILHGDFAARNFLLCDDNVVKICDFDLAKSLYKKNSTSTGRV